jgi:hypothetical protein
MPQNFIGCNREQAFLMPPSLRDWIAGDHLVWTILGAVDEIICQRSMARIAPMVMAGRRMSRR